MVDVSERMKEIEGRIAERRRDHRFSAISYMIGYGLLGLSAFIDLKLETVVMAAVIVLSTSIGDLRGLLVDTQHRQIRLLIDLLYKEKLGYEVPKREDHQ